MALKRELGACLSFTPTKSVRPPQSSNEEQEKYKHIPPMDEYQLVFEQNVT